MRATTPSPSIQPILRCVALSLPVVLASVLAAGAALAQSAPMRATQPAAQPAAPAGSAAQPAAEQMTGGKVLETMNASNYTYARVQTPAGEKWVAGPQTPLKVGDEVRWPGGSEMPNFTSKTLNRTFESILFVGQLVVAGAPVDQAQAVGSAHGTLSGKAADAPEVKAVPRAKGGLTVGEIYDRRADLDGKEVVVRGKVVKFNAGVMDRNWLHVRDGSHGAKGDNDLTVTSDGQAAVGDTVVVRGKVVLNKDFGFNYKYDVMVEGATVTVE